MLAVAISIVIIGYLQIQWQVVHRLAPERICGVVVVVAACAIGKSIDRIWLFVVVGVVVAIMQAISTRRYQRDPFAPQ